jgi:hypothetical protein
MQYNQPFDQPSNPNASYTNGNPSTGTLGSIPPAASIEYPQREIVNFITDSGIIPTNNDLHQTSKSVQSGAVQFAFDTGTANAMVGAFTPAITSLTPGLTVRVKKGPNPNSGPTTFDAGTGANAVHRANGAALNPNDLPASTAAEMTWDGSAWQISNFQGFNATNTTINNFTTDIPYAVDSGSPGAIQANFSPAITVLPAGLMVLVKLANNITGQSGFEANSTGFNTILRPEGIVTQNGDAIAGQVLCLVYNGSNWVITGRPQYKAAYYSVAGNYQWTCPPGVFYIKCHVTGGGGGGGSVCQNSGPLCGGCGGGGGYAEGIIPVIPGGVYGITVGAGGAGQSSTAGGPGATGGTTSFNGILTATGGGGGDGQGQPILAGGVSGMGSGGYKNCGLGDGSTGAALYPGDFNLVAPGCGGGPGGQSGAGNPGQPVDPMTGRGPGGGGGGIWRADLGCQAGNGAPGDCLIEYLQ